MVISFDSVKISGPDPSSGVLPAEEFSQCVFFDIETTGLSWRTSHVCLIGAAWRDGSGWRMRQWFLQNPSGERELLKCFASFLSGFSGTVHYNGSTFDLPYLRRKYAFYRMADPLEGMKSRDLYQSLRPFQKSFGLTSMKQKDLERLLSFPRRDRITRESSVGCYRKYLETGSEEFLRLILLHNCDDVLGMLSILPLMACPALLDGDFSVAGGRITEDTLELWLSLRVPLPLPLILKGKYSTLSGEGDAAVLAVPGTRGTMKHYFPDYKNYFYLPVEDTAVHRSVGVYVDTEFRQRAKADTCYQKADGLFFPQPQIRFQPDFRRSYRGEPSFFQAGEEWPEGQNREVLKSYVLDLLHQKIT